MENELYILKALQQKVRIEMTILLAMPQFEIDEAEYYNSSYKHLDFYDNKLHLNLLN
jgi:hypothetical protein